MVWDNACAAVPFALPLRSLGVPVILQAPGALTVRACCPGGCPLCKQTMTSQQIRQASRWSCKGLCASVIPRLGNSFRAHKIPRQGCTYPAGAC